ncbi:MAG: hypothetical protein KKA64_04680 [Nanoarchaeota archaeon]|nr:hypothetical protein [Nanoarchaeota archaeon]
MEKEKTDDPLVKEREEKIAGLLKKSSGIYYLVLAFIVWLGVYIRTRNIPLLKDISTGTWTLGPDLDPFLFLRWAEYIAEHGKLFVIDTMRNVPLGFKTSEEMGLLSYMIAWLHKLLVVFSLSDSVTYSAIIFPVVMFALTTIAFFLFARKIFYKENKVTKNSIALLATALFVLIPSLLPRTIAGIPEKESAAFFFMFLAFYFFLEAFTSEKIKKGLIFGVLAGISTGLMALIWGGMIFIYLTIPTAFLFAFALGKIKKENFYVYSCWLVSSFAVMMPFSARYSLKNLITSFSTGTSIGVLVLVGISLLIIKDKRMNQIKEKIKIPPEILSLIVSALILLMAILIFLGPNFILSQIGEIKRSLIQPSYSRFSFTVAENKQPYFISDWGESFGPVFRGIPVFFWLFFIGSVFLFDKMISGLKKRDRLSLTISYLIFLSAIIFSRYSESGALNGVNTLSVGFYALGVIAFIGCFWYVYKKNYDKNEFDIFNKFEFSYILYFIILTLGIIGARGAIRLIMVLGAVSPITIAFLSVSIFKGAFKEKEEMAKLFSLLAIAILIISLIFTFYNYYQGDKLMAENFAPGYYQGQWQKAMAWVRENTPENAVFAHWWDYGYWLQSIGKRATVLDGGNAIVYWNHLLGRHVLTGSDEGKALEFLYTHNATHLLIDSTDIGKYPAFSSIGADENYDRFSWISTFIADDKQTQELNNETIYLLMGGTATDDDILWEKDGREVFLPARKTLIGAIVLREKKSIGQIGSSFLQPEGIFVYQEQQYRIPLRYIYVDYKQEKMDFKTGLESGVFLFPNINYINEKGININYFGAALYLSNRTVNSQLARLYLFNQQSSYFKLAHTESSFIIENLRTNGVNIGEFVQYQGFQGPIKIWEIEYPLNIKVNPEFLKTEYPNKELAVAKKGEYG